MEENTGSRFTHKADDYEKYRPAYPAALLEFMIDKLRLSSKSVIADIGSGTGISAALFVAQGITTYGVEPNGPMREKAETIFSGSDYFISIEGSSEQTNLSPNSVDFIFCGQAFHWFDKVKSKIEFNRILKDKGNILLAWNIIDERDPIGFKYQQILKENIDGYAELQNIKISEQEIQDFFSPNAVHEMIFKNAQLLDLPGFLGRLRSSSMVPTIGEVYEMLKTRLELLFKEYSRNNHIIFGYETRLYWR